jgi:hypothetical protein
MSEGKHKSPADRGQCLFLFTCDDEFNTEYRITNSEEKPRMRKSLLEELPKSKAVGLSKFSQYSHWT